MLLFEAQTRNMKLTISLGLLLIASASFGQSLQSTAKTTKKLKPEVKKEWHNLSFKDAKVYGTGTDQVYSEQLAGAKPKKKIVVAVIDSGVDIEHEDLSESIWTNTNEIPNNGKDDDQNGFVDDVHGWNFLVDSNGQNVIYDNMEATRVLRLSKRLKNEQKPYPEWLTEEVLTDAVNIYNESSEEMSGLGQFSLVYNKIDSTAKAATGKEEYTYKDVKNIKDSSEDIKKAKRIFSVFKTLGIEQSDLEEMDSQADKYAAYWLNFDFDPKAGMPQTGSKYGNNHYGGEHAEHGTHVAGIIASTRDNDKGSQGVAYGAAEIMVLRAVPDGDERDLDVANAIRYAADNGASIINMSLGKGISPDKRLVYDALNYAASKNVLIVHAAGNDSEDIDEANNYPNDDGLTLQGQSSFLCIGALSPTKGKKITAAFSNYGTESVDIFAPGEDIYSTLPGNNYGFRSGTSMAAPVACGVAALVWSMNPELTALQLQQLLIKSATDLSDKKVLIPGTKEKVAFKTLCKSGSVINAYSALNMIRTL